MNGTPAPKVDDESPPIRFANALNHPSNTSHPKIGYEVAGKHYSDAEVDSWELRASRRALANLKHLLYDQQMVELIRPQIEQGDAYFKNLLATSDGQWRECRTDLHVSGVKIDEIMAARKKLLGMTREEMALEALLPAHPEHYAVPSYEGEEGIIEVVGEHMARIRLNGSDPAPDFVHAYGDPAFPAKKPTTCKLEDGTAVWYMLHEFGNTDDGCNLRLRIIFPANAPDVFFKEHAEHLAIEFRFGIRTVFQQLRDDEVTTNGYH